MKPLSALPHSEARALRGVLFDLDDTLLDHGKLTEAAYSALFRLRESGLALYVVTGRPLSWVRLIARLFPLDGGVGENGGVMVAAGGRALEILAPAERTARSTRLASLVSEVRDRFRDIEPADDATERLSDFTFDIGEHQRVAPERVAELAAFAKTRGATVHVSSVHLHVGFDAVDKATGVVRLLRTLHGTDPSVALTRYAFVGDSENDAACFGAFSVTVGVANLRGRPTLAPRYLTQAPRGQGVAELAHVLAALRASAE